MSREMSSFLDGVNKLLRMFDTFSFLEGSLLQAVKVAPATPLKMSPATTPKGTPQKGTPSPKKPNAFVSPKKSPAPISETKQLIAEKKEAFIACLERVLDIANLNSDILMQELQPKFIANPEVNPNANAVKIMLVLLTYAYALKSEIAVLSQNTENLHVNTPLQQRYKVILDEQLDVYQKELYLKDIFDVDNYATLDFASRFKDSEQKIKHFSVTFLEKQPEIFKAFAQLSEAEVCNILLDELDIGGDDANELGQALLKWTMQTTNHQQVLTSPVRAPTRVAPNSPSASAGAPTPSPLACRTQAAYGPLSDKSLGEEGRKLGSNVRRTLFPAGPQDGRPNELPRPAFTA